MALKNMILMRHAKSSWKFDDLSDHQRPLNGRGRKAAKKIGQVLRAKKIFPQTIWSSDSARTRETVSRLLHDKSDPDVEYLSGFYHSSGNNILYLCQDKSEPEQGPLMLVGHNPGWQDLVYFFAGTHQRMPTGACAIFQRTDKNADWLNPNAWKLQELILPRDLEA